MAISAGVISNFSNIAVVLFSILMRNKNLAPVSYLASSGNVIFYLIKCFG